MSTSIAIIGAGVSGLSCATNLLHKYKSIKDPSEKLSVTLFDKAVKPGGRLSTRRGIKIGGKYQFDHGAQYFTARDPVFVNALNDWISAGVAAEWKSPIKVIDVSNHQITETSTENKRYVGVDGMNSIAQHLAKDLNIQANHRITTITRNSKWTLVTDKGDTFDGFDIVVISIPSPQAETLLTEKLLSELSWKSKLSEVKMEPCWTLMLGFDHKLEAKFDGAFVHNSPLSWIARNSRHAEADCWVLQGSPEWSAKHVNLTPVDVTDKLKASFLELLQIKEMPSIDTEMIHRWLYSSVPKSLDDKYLFDTEKGVALIGDWLNGSRVEGAFMSGYHLSNKLFENLFPKHVKSHL